MRLSKKADPDTSRENLMHKSTDICIGLCFSCLTMPPAANVQVLSHFCSQVIAAAHVHLSLLTA